MSTPPIPTPDAPTPAECDRMTKAFTLYQDLLFAATGSPPAKQLIGLDFLQVLYEAPDTTLDALAALTKAHADLLGSLIPLDVLATRLHITEKALKRLARMGAITGYKHPLLGWLFTEKEIHTYLDRKTFLGGIPITALRRRGGA